MFHLQIGWNVEVYMDDMLVKSMDEGKHLNNLQETFDTLRQYDMKLNPNKCAFGVSLGKFLRFMVSHRGIEANLLLDEMLPLTGLSLKLLTSVCHLVI